MSDSYEGKETEDPSSTEDKAKAVKRPAAEAAIDVSCAQN